jgi:formate hydrogenlyase subunit 6/NADH:ubiquinone oxidoreductase subunit I
MNIFQVLLHNFGKRSRTRKPDNEVPFPADFRGELTHKAVNCTLCGTCVYVCSPGAITIEREDESGIWEYDAGRCTFCGRCVQYCPGAALSFLTQSAPTVNTRAQELTSHIVENQHCKRCGAVILPLRFDALVRLYHSEEAAASATEIHELCERCRGRAHGETLKHGLTGRKS